MARTVLAEIGQQVRSEIGCEAQRFVVRTGLFCVRGASLEAPLAWTWVYFLAAVIGTVFQALQLDRARASQADLGAVFERDALNVAIAPLQVIGF
jgi:hypothetical protein